MEDIYASCREEAKKKIQEEIKKGLEHKTLVQEGCDDFLCCFAGTILCVPDSCSECALNNCRGCEHLEECINF